MHKRIKQFSIKEVSIDSGETLHDKCVRVRSCIRLVVNRLTRICTRETKAFRVYTSIFFQVAAPIATFCATTRESVENFAAVGINS